jgi:glycosyltransferase involved in cell wall biosynthesis
VATVSGTQPRVSIGVPVYNGERLIGQTLDALLAQRFEDYELIISDNASTDATAAICAQYAAQDRRIRYVRNPVNIGANPNFTRVVELARAPYFKLANADDLCEPELVGRCVEVLDRHPEVILCYARARLIDGDGNWLGDFDDRLDLRDPDPTARFLAVMDRLRLVNVLQGVVRTDVLRRIPHRSYPSADILVVAELALQGHFVELPERLFARRMHAGAASGLQSSLAKQAFADPTATKRHNLEVLSAHAAFLSAIVRAPVTTRGRFTLARWWLRSARWNRDRIGSALWQWAASRRFSGAKQV